jgi:hypothetical protein
MSFTYGGETEPNLSIYDPDDYARDWADALANLLSGTGVTIYTIGLGSEVQDTTRVAVGEPPMAESLLKYIAECAGEGRTDDCTSPPLTNPQVNHGQYFYAPSFSQLELIFAKIAQNIATKISQ